MDFNPKDAGKRLQKLRMSLGYNQEQFSEKLNVSRAYYAKLETGARNPSVYLWVDIATLTGASLDYLLMGKEEISEHSKKKILAGIAQIQEALNTR